MPKLSIALPDSKTVHELTDERITIGRAPDNMIQIDDPSVSGRHAQLLLIDERYQLKDLGSTNGTRVNSELVTDTFLRVGDRIRFGKVEARYESDATGEAQPLPDAGEIEARPAERSEKPADFANASPFPNRQKEKDTGGTAIRAAAALAILAFLLSMLSLLRIHGPVW
jgi:predicted component of type VI protein secretion system